VVQQAFVKAYEAMHRDAADLNLRPWLYRIAHNGALNALRDRALRHAELDDRIDGVERPDQAFERATGLRELVVAVQALPERQRGAILLRELEGRSYDEIALALGVTDGAVRQLLNRARNSLRSAAAAVTPMPLLTRLAAGDSTEPVTARVAELVGAGSGALAMKLCATALVTGAVVGGAAVVPDVGREHASGPSVGAQAAQAAGSAVGAESGESRVARANDSGEGSQAERRQESSGHRSGGAEERGERSGRGDDDDDGDGERGEHRSGHGGGDPGDDREERSGRRGEDDDDHSGPGGGGDDDEPEGGPDDHSGPGDGGGAEEPENEPEEAREDRSGPGGGETELLEPPEPPEPEELDSSGSGSGSGSSGSD
jgi:RNA polymerase sigma factor (sigma-70 family)